MGTIGEAIRQRRSLLRSGGTGLILNAGLVLLVTLFGILLIQRIYDQGASFFLQILAFALANGGIYALIALGYTMVYGIIELINFAHGDVFAFGTFLSASLIPIFGLAEGQAFGPGTALALVVVFVDRTRLGKAMRATAQDRDAALLMGIDIDQTIAATFFIGAVLAGAGGTMFGLYYNTSVFDLGFSAGLFAFTAAVFGGIGNIYGAAIGGMFIGIIRSFWDGYFDSAWTDVVIFAILILTLVFRPTGVLGMRVPEK